PTSSSFVWSKGSTSIGVPKVSSISFRYEKKLKFMEQPMGPAPPDPKTTDLVTIVKYYESVNLEQKVAWKTIAELHAMLKLHEKGIPKKAETLAVLAKREGKIQKERKKPQGAKGKNEVKTKLAYATKPKIPPTPKRDNLEKDSICHRCKEVGH
nr:zinc finger, CCHC-type [Tanacetum cinerariifolium]